LNAAAAPHKFPAIVVGERSIPSIGNDTTFGVSYLDLATSARSATEGAREAALIGRFASAGSARTEATRVPTILTSKHAE
jgi:hypothetical protein